MVSLEKNENPHDYRIRFCELELGLLKNYHVKKILEVFCGDGRNLEILNKLGYDILGVEDSSHTKKTICNDLMIISHDIFDKLPFDDESFDCVYSYQYINHNYKNKIEGLFIEIYRVLKIGGLFSIKTSDSEQFNICLVENDIYEEQDPEFPKMFFKRIADKTYLKLGGDEKGVPHYFFRKDELIGCLEKIGFRLVNIRTIRWNLVANFEK